MIIRINLKYWERKNSDRSYEPKNEIIFADCECGEDINLAVDKIILTYQKMPNVHKDVIIEDIILFKP